MRNRTCNPWRHGSASRPTCGKGRRADGNQIAPVPRRAGRVHWRCRNAPVKPRGTFRRLREGQVDGTGEVGRGVLPGPRREGPMTDEEARLAAGQDDPTRATGRWAKLAEVASTPEYWVLLSIALAPVGGGLL